MLSKILEFLKLIPGLLSMLIALVNLFEVPGHGPEKKNAVLVVVGLALDFIAGFITLPFEKEKILDFAGKTIDAIVAFFNAVNVFKKNTVNPT